MEEVQLRVEKAYPMDLGRGIIRLDPTALLTLYLSLGDSVEIIGKKKTTAKVWRADREDWELGITRVDNFIRQSAGVSIGDTVTIKKVSPQKAKKLVLAFLDNTTQGGPEVDFDENTNEIIKRHILKRSIISGDIVPIVTSISEQKSLTELPESLTTSQVIPLVAISTIPSDVVVQVFEETEVELLDKAAKRKTTKSKFDNSKAKSEIVKVQNNSSSSEFDTIAAQLESIKVKLDTINIPNIDNYFSLSQAIAEFVTDKKDKEIDIITLAENVSKTKDHFEKIVRNITENNTKYNIEDNVTLSVLKNVMDKSDKIIFEYICSLKLPDAFKYVNELDFKLDIYHRVALSEIAHKKIKEIEFQVNNPFFFVKSRRNYRQLVNELAQLDNDGVQGTKDLKEFISTIEQIMKKIKETEDNLEDEKRSGIYHTISNYFIVIISLLLSFYQLVAAKYLNIDPLLPIIVSFFLFVAICLLLKSGSSLKIIYLGYKNNLFTKSDITASVFSIIFFLMIFSGPIDLFIPDFLNVLIPNYTKYILPFGIVLTIFYLLKESVKEAKLKLTIKEIKDLIEKYGFDVSIRT